MCTEDISQDDLNKNQNMLSFSLENTGTESRVEGGNGNPRKSETPNFSANNFLRSMIDEKRHGNDRYIKKIWHKFHPDQIHSPKNKVSYVI